MSKGAKAQGRGQARPPLTKADLAAGTAESPTGQQQGPT